MTLIDDLRLRILDGPYGPKNSTAFTDGELQQFLIEANDAVSKAAGNALLVLVKDRDRLKTWVRADTDVDYDQIAKNVGEVAMEFLAPDRYSIATVVDHGNEAYQDGVRHERDRIRNEVVRWQDKALEMSVDKGFSKATRELYDCKYWTYQRVLDLLDCKEATK